MLLTYILISSFQLLLLESKLMTSHHVICYVTTVMCLFIKNKRNIKLRKMLVSKCTITRELRNELVKNEVYCYSSRA